nr:hypothetical protein BaRGS_014365 [Batillaria attramentaria]
MRMIHDDERLAFIVEWYEEMAARTRQFQFFYFVNNQSVEMYDIKNRKMFLRASVKDQNLTLSDLYIGSCINVCGRMLNVVDYGDQYTRSKLCNKKEKTFAMIKPDAVDKLGQILDGIYQRGFLITRLRMVYLERDQALVFYEEHRNKPFLSTLLDYVTSGPIVAFEIVGENAVGAWRDAIGPTDPSEARKTAPTTLRAQFGKGIAGKIINAITESGFRIGSAFMVTLEKANAEEFLEVYKGVVQEYNLIVTELTSGPCIALEVVGNDTSERVVTAFRELAGPADPEIARHLRPRTLRAIFGTDKIKNAVHCTDLAEDGQLEVEYFFRILDR